MEPVVFTPVTSTERAALCDLFVRVRGRDLGADAWDEPLRTTTMRLQFEAQQRGYTEQFPAATTSFLTRHGERAGWIVVDRSGPPLHLVDIAVVPEARGQGIATAALRSLQEEAAAAGRALELTVDRGNDGALRLYSRLGFQAIAADDLQLRLQWRAAWSAALFRPAVGSGFAVDGAAAPLTLVLTELQERPSAHGFAHFSLIFHGPGEPLLPQNSYLLRHDRLGAVVLFLVPVLGSNAERVIYEAAFSVPSASAR